MGSFFIMREVMEYFKYDEEYDPYDLNEKMFVTKWSDIFSFLISVDFNFIVRYCNESSNGE